MRIDIDNDGYPTDESLEGLEACLDPIKALDAVADYLICCGYGTAKKRGNYWRFATGGWSGCESVINAISPVVHGLAWRSSHRGGLHIYMVPK